jgi:UDP-3-O-[3-hydroxymyristoyl] glucosamine N-acyltransferase
MEQTDYSFPKNSEEMKVAEIEFRNILAFLEQNHIDFSYEGNQEVTLNGFSPVTEYRPGTLTWLKNVHKYEQLKAQLAGVAPTVIVTDRQVGERKAFQNALVCDNPKYVFYFILSQFFCEKREILSNNRCDIHPSVRLGENVVIGCNCVLEKDVVIGAGTRLYHNVVIREGTVIGEHCVIKSGTVIGEEGYGYSRGEHGLFHVPHFGHVKIEDHVEIGSNCSIDCGTMNDTVIGAGSKIDNLCHIAHNVTIGKNVCIVAGAVVGGSAVIADDSYIAPGGIIRNQIRVGEGSLIGMGSVVTKDVPAKKVVAGVPGEILRDVGEENL